MSWTKTGQCAGGVAQPVTRNVSCAYQAPVCTYTYSAWGDCTSSGIQTHTVTSSSPANCQGVPSLSQSCTYVPPTPLCTTNNWTSTVSPTTCPSSGSQTMSWTKTGQCAGGVAQPVTRNVSCAYQAPVCTYTYSAWGDCTSSGIQTHIVISSSPSNCSGGASPVLSQACTYIPPISSCVESNWTSTISPTTCPSSGSQTKAWTKIGNCVGGITHPATENVSCVYTPPVITFPNTGGMKSVPGDYNGDGTSDSAFWNPTDGKWYIRSSDGSVIANGKQYGASTMTPVSMDYDKDGTYDLALLNSDGKWYIYSLVKNDNILWNSASLDNALSTKIKIMAIGDSITEANTYNLAWRYWLWKKLTDNGYDNFNFVGSMRGVLCSPIESCQGDVYNMKWDDQDHDGHNGWATANILNGNANQPLRRDIHTWATTYAPDIALIFIGINDFHMGGWFVYGNGSGPQPTLAQDRTTITNATNNVSSIIDVLRRNNSKVKILLAKIIPSSLVPDSDVASLNSSYSTLAANKTTSISPVTMVDINSIYNKNTDSIDGVHPNQSGASKIADKWYTALMPYIDPSYNLTADFIPPPPTQVTELVSPAGALTESAIDGSCSTTHYSCTAGVKGVVAEYTTDWQWWCNGSNGGTNTLCSEKKPVVSNAINGSCSTAHYSCTTGVRGATAEYTTDWQWWCNGSNGGTNILCAEKKPIVSNVINGSCSTAHYSCTTGVRGATAEYATDWQWWCNGSNGGTNILCAEAKKVTDDSTSPQNVAATLVGWESFLKLLQALR